MTVVLRSVYPMGITTLMMLYQPPRPGPGPRAGGRLRDRLNRKAYGADLAAIRARSGGVLGDPVIRSIAERTGKTPAQVVLRWHIQRGDIVFPKSVTPDRIRENIDIFDFELSAADVGDITVLNKNERTGPDPDKFDGR